jgi:lipid-binding SYLF domain-containing protein
VSLILIFLIGVGLSGEALAKKQSKEEERADVRKMANETLDSLYKEQPSARKIVETAAGYGVFSNFGLKIFVLGSGKGKGIVINLYKEQPSARKIVEKAAGYGVFSNFGLKIFVLGSGKGKGIVINKKNNKETFMKMLEAQAGLGIGAKKFKQVWVFQSQKALNDFVNSGWEFGGQVTAAAKAGDKGGDLAGAIAVDTDILLYQLTDTGLALEFTAKGTKYYKDKDLN